jgi:hypothetical protein
MKRIDWFAAGFWALVVLLVAIGGFGAFTLHRIAETQEDILKETRIHTAYIRGAVPIAENHDACGH